jgi:tetratricopeptide (TPR) repeat protein
MNTPNVYDEAGHLLGEYDATGALIEETVWLGDTPVATVRPGTPVRSLTEMLDAQIARLEERVRDDDPTAVEDALKLADRYSGEPKVWSLLAYAHARRGSAEDAIVDIARAIELSPLEIGLYFERGRYLLKLGRHRQAVDDFDRALNFCEQQQNDYYRESLFFMRADALSKLDRKAAALVDLSNVRDDFALWTTELRTKQALLAECAK